MSSYGSSINAISLQERYRNSNPFGSYTRVNTTNPIQTSPYEPIGTTEVVDNVKYNAPKADKNLSYAGFYSPLYGQPNYNGQKLDILGA